MPTDLQNRAFDFIALALFVSLMLLGASMFEISQVFSNKHSSQEFRQILLNFSMPCFVGALLCTINIRAWRFLGEELFSLTKASSEGGRSSYLTILRFLFAVFLKVVAFVLTLAGFVVFQGSPLISMFLGFVGLLFTFVILLAVFYPLESYPRPAPVKF